jgi:hypothetical protein
MVSDATPIVSPNIFFITGFAMSIIACEPLFKYAKILTPINASRIKMATHHVYEIPMNELAELDEENNEDDDDDKDTGSAYFGNELDADDIDEIAGEVDEKFIE